MNRIELAKSLGISRQMLHRHEKAGRLKPESNGGFDESRARAQLESNVRQKRGGSPRQAEAGASALPRRASPPEADLGGAKATTESRGDPNTPSLAKIQQLHEGYKAKKTKIQVEQLDGTLISAKEAELAWAGMVTATRNELLSLHENAGMKFGDECGAWLKVEIRRALDNLSGYRPSA